ncbi:MAG: dihydroorotase family protein [Candidatus Bathyarchaeia archaeon]
MVADLVLNNAKAYVKRELMDCSIAIKDGKILKMGKEANMPEAHKKIDLKGLLVLPGLIDVHVHLRDEGKAYKEDFYSGTAAAAAGGITTVLDMPNNEPVTMSSEALRNRMKTAEKKVLVNVGFYTEFPKDLKEMEMMVNVGAFAFKLFMGEQIGGLNIDDDKALMEAFKIARRLNVPVAVHAEDKATLEKVKGKFKNANISGLDAFLKAHSTTAETKAVKRLLKIAKQTGVRLHFCHLSTKNSLKLVAEAKKSGMTITCEATPHHLLLTVDDLKRLGLIALTVPPLREKHHAEALWDGIKNRWIDIIASDHAPHTLGEKSAKSVWDVKVGIPGLETILCLLLTEVKGGRLSIGDIVELLAHRPAEVFNLRGRGYLREGYSADLTIVDLNVECKVDSSKFFSKAKFSPFDGWILKGKPVKTYVNGRLIMDDGEIVAEAGSGKILRRE